MLTRRFAARFSQLASGALAVVLATGIYNAWQVLPAVSALWASPYGRLLGIKLLFVAGMIAGGAINHFRITPRLQAATASGDVALLLRRFQQSVLLESVLLLFVLAVTALLLGGMPPAA